MRNSLGGEQLYPNSGIEYYSERNLKLEDLRFRPVL